MECILKNISKYRSTLMGIAMLWVVLHHCNCLTHYAINKIIAFPFLNLGYLGVDMFMFLSGFGIYYSLEKNPDVLQFLIKRIKRFLPAILFFVIYIICKKITSIHAIIGYVCFQDFLLQDSFLWFLSAIFFFYLLSPVLKNIISNHLHNGKSQLLFLAVICLISLSYIGYKLYGVARLPIYIIGMYAGYNFCNKKQKDKIASWLIISFVLGFLLLLIVFCKFVDVRHYYGLVYYPAILFIPGLIYLLVLLIEKFDSIWKSNPVLKILNYIGKNSLTIYAVDGFITDYMHVHYFFIHLTASVILGCLYGYIWEKFIDKHVGSIIKKSGKFLAT